MLALINWLASLFAGSKTVMALKSYNGFSPAQRFRKLRAMHKQFPNRSHPFFTGHCSMCGSPQDKVQPHSEDYSEPFSWGRPAMFPVCRTCHTRLHRRFGAPYEWAAYKLHIQRGGYGSDLRNSLVANELKRAAREIAAGVSNTMPRIRDVRSEAWHESLKAFKRSALFDEADV